MSAALDASHVDLARRQARSEASTATVSVFDHGLLYGDGVFEGIRVYNRRVFRLEAAPRPALRFRQGDRARRSRSTARRWSTRVRGDRQAPTRQEDGYIRLVVTRGVGDLGVDPRKCPKPTVIIIVTDIQVYPTELYAQRHRRSSPRRRARCRTRRSTPRVKRLNYLKNILAKIDAHRAGAHEAIMLNAEGLRRRVHGRQHLRRRDGMLLTPSPQDGALEGITRGAHPRARGRGRHPGARDSASTRYDVYTADECFLTGTGAEVMPVAEVDGRQIGDGTPGPMTKRLIEAFHALVRREGDPIW